eukprot:TRINITY_DN4507_c0_g1_i5.p1 TRINITY_DN4507_c0_g1~~TRINITY_DN4507_c0_g1_i5.p1  ORF type:complete len:503 (-),score=105.88 TRINITY_DN4507_c0_g1_i5:67-1575(-)
MRIVQRKRENIQPRVEEEVQQDDPAGPYCVCRGADDGTPMICCDNCNEWYHLACINMTQKQSRSMPQFYCHVCRGVEVGENDRANILPGATEKSHAKLESSESSTNSHGFVTRSKSGGSVTDAVFSQKRQKVDSNTTPSIESSPKIGRSSPLMPKVKKLLPPKSPIVKKQEMDPVRTRCAMTLGESLALDIKDGTEPSTESNPLETSKAEDSTETQAQPTETNPTSTPPSTNGESSESTIPSTPPPLEAQPDEWLNLKNQETEEKVESSISSPPTAADAIALQPESLEKIESNSIEATPSPAIKPESSSSSTSPTDIIPNPEAIRLRSRARELGFAIEKSMYDMYGSTGKDYKAKYRTLFFNLKDLKNIHLRSSIMEGIITPEELCKMSVTDLANDELGAYRKEREKKSADQVVIKESDQHPLMATQMKGDLATVRNARKDTAIVERQGMEPIAIAPIKIAPSSSTSDLRDPNATDASETNQEPALGGECQFLACRHIRGVH